MEETREHQGRKYNLRSAAQTCHMVDPLKAAEKEEVEKKAGKQAEKSVEKKVETETKKLAEKKTEESIEKPVRTRAVAVQDFQRYHERVYPNVKKTFFFWDPVFGCVELNSTSCSREE